jgi:hypothetical protein
MGPIAWPKTSVNKYQPMLQKTQKIKDLNYTAAKV